MTMFDMKRDEAKAKAQELMSPYGLEINMQCSSWSYTDSTCKSGVLTVHTKRHPVKGNKALIEKLKADGYTVWVIGSRSYETGKRWMEFWVDVEAKYDC